MITWKRGAGILLLLFAVGLVAPGYAIAGPGAILYELTENMSLGGVKSPHRRATSELMGFAAVGTPLCPQALVDAVSPGATFCTLNATGRDNISLVTGKGHFNGTVTVVVQGDNPVDSPEFVIAKGKFEGKMDFSPAILGGIPFGSVVGKLSFNGGKRVPFTGTFLLPFVLPEYYGDTALYLDLATGSAVPVAANEHSLGYPTVKFEISFD